MAHQVEFDDVRRAIAEFGPVAGLVTVAETLRPHVVTAEVEVDGQALVADVGATTRANLLTRPDLALVWYPTGGGEYQLILDGTVQDVGEPGENGVSTVRIAVVGGILHRLAGLPGDAPSCRSLKD